MATPGIFLAPQWQPGADLEQGMPMVGCPIIRECFVGSDAGHAASACDASLRYKYRAYASWGHGDTVGHDLDHHFEDFCRDRFLIGDAQYVRDEFQRYAEMPGVERLVLRVQWPGLSHAEALGNIERVGKLFN